MKEIKADSYRLETPSGSWLGQVVLTSDGFLGSVTDYGNFSFAWRCIGQQSFKEFLLTLSEDYFSRKLAQGISYIAHGRNIDNACERFAKEILPELKKKLQEELELEKLQGATQKRYLIRNTYDTAIKNKLDGKLRAEFRKHLHKIVTGLDIPKFKILHAQIQNEYLSAGGRCKPFEYRDSVKHFTPTSSRTNFMIYVTDGYWIELIEVNETPFD